jgi:hypothetical protein
MRKRTHRLRGREGNTKGTQGVCDILNRINETMGEVVRRIDAPIVTSNGMWYVLDTVCYKIAHVGVWAAHVFKSQ